MPLVDKPLSELRTYTGITPKPTDFDAYWEKALADLDATDPAPVLERTTAIKPRNAEAFDLWFTGVGGAKIHAKYLRPKKSTAAHPAVLQFHGYSGSSGEWHDKLNFVSEGTAVAALDCRGQGGLSEDNAIARGNTQQGHFIRGLDDSPEKLLFRSIFLDTAQLARVVMAFDEVDAERIGTIGGSQGGALSLVCASLVPTISRCVSLYPFLSDYKRVWEMDLAKDAYLELRNFFRLFDPRHEREDEIFTRLGYIDIKNLTPRIKAETLVGLSLMDTICPPSTQFAAFNNISAKKEGVIYPDFGHEGLPGFHDIAFNFLLEL